LAELALVEMAGLAALVGMVALAVVGMVDLATVELTLGNHRR
jgi:hypothetical protein